MANDDKRSGTAQRPRFVIEERNWFNTPARCVQEGDAVRFYGIVTKIEPGAGKSVRITFDGSRLRPPLSLHMDDLVRVGRFS